MKLVRDRIGDLPWPDAYHGAKLGDEHKRDLGYVTVGSPEYGRLLVEKLREEVCELIEAFRGEGTRDEVIGEAGDVLEVLAAILWIDGADVDEHALVTERLAAAIDAADRKRAERGGFTEGRTYSGPVRDTHPYTGRA